ncbi:MAG: ABC transporter ATP-binding protein [Robiginitomaculum sp.]
MADIKTQKKSPDAHADRGRVKRLWRGYIAPHKGALFIAFFFMLILAATQMAYVFLIQKVIDFSTTMTGDVSGDANAVDTAIHFASVVMPLIIGITIISGAALFIQSIFTNKVALSTIAALQKDMLTSLQSADFAEVQKQPVGNLISKFTNDVNVLSQALLRAMTNLVRDLLTIIGLVISMFWIDWMLTLIIILTYPLIVAPLMKISKALRGDSAQVQEHMGVITSGLNENFSGLRMVKTYGLEARQSEKLNASFMERVRLYLKLVTNHAKVDPITEVMGGIVISVIFVMGIYRVLGGHMTGGAIAAILGAVLLLAPKARALGTLNNVIQEGHAALKRIFEVIDTQPTIVDASGARPLNISGGQVVLDAVEFAYGENIKALSGVDITAKPGQTIALVGPSGGGKSTIINLIPRLYDVSAGAVKIDGQDIREVTLKSLRENIALVSQDATLFDDTIAANISFGKLSASQGEIEKAAKAAAAHAFIMALPDGYQTRAGESGNTLSGGQKQRISLARAILRDAPILLLDEATSALDAQSEAKVQAALETLSKSRTTIVIAHRLSTVKNADMIYVLEDGAVTQSGSHAQLMKAGGLYAKLRKLQFS